MADESDDAVGADESADDAPDMDREIVRALRKCTPDQRRWLRMLPQYDWSEWRAGVALGHSRHTVYRWLRKPHVKRYLDLIRDRDIVELEFNHLSILKGYLREEQADIRNLYDTGGRLLPPDQWPDREARCVQEYYFDQNGNPRVKLADQRGARDRLAKYLKMFTERHELTGKDGAPLASMLPVIQVVRYSDEGDADAPPASSAD